MQPKAIEQVSKYCFSLKWRDGITTTHRLSELQKMCPCSDCAGKRPVVDPDVMAHSIRSVGRYGLKIAFTSGCSRGVYTYMFLRKVASCER